MSISDYWWNDDIKYLTKNELIELMVICGDRLEAIWMDEITEAAREDEE